MVLVELSYYDGGPVTINMDWVITIQDLGEHSELIMYTEEGIQVKQSRREVMELARHAVQQGGSYTIHEHDPEHDDQRCRWFVKKALTSVLMEELRSRGVDDEDYGDYLLVSNK